MHCSLIYELPSSLQRSMQKLWFWRPLSSTGSRPASTSSPGLENKTTFPSLKGAGTAKRATIVCLDVNTSCALYELFFFPLFSKSCFSSVGNRRVGKQRLSIGKNCDRIATIEHEFLHALGFWHEQSRADRDDYVKIMWDRISEGIDHLTASWSAKLEFMFA